MCDLNTTQHKKANNVQQHEIRQRCRLARKGAGKTSNLHGNGSPTAPASGGKRVDPGPTADLAMQEVGGIGRRTNRRSDRLIKPGLE